MFWCNEIAKNLACTQANKTSFSGVAAGNHRSNVSVHTSTKSSPLLSLSTRRTATIPHHKNRVCRFVCLFLHHQQLNTRPYTISHSIMLRVKLMPTRRQATRFDVPMTVRRIEKSHWSSTTMRRRRQGNDKKVCNMCVVFKGNNEPQEVSSLRCTLYTVASCDIGEYGPQREARITCKHVCIHCYTIMILLKHLNDSRE